MIHSILFLHDYHVAFALQSATHLKPLRHRLPEILKKEAGHRIDIYYDAFFKPDDMRFISDKDLAIMKDYLFAKLPSWYTEATVEGMAELAEFINKEKRIFKNLDNSPISATTVHGEGYRKLLVYKQQADRKLYLFWGNPLAKQPQYDLAELVMKQKPDELPIAYLGQVRSNTNFAGDNARLPFTERYKYLLYIVVIMAIAGLIFLQYRVYKRIGQ